MAVVGTTKAKVATVATKAATAAGVSSVGGSAGGAVVLTSGVTLALGFLGGLGPVILAGVAVYVALGSVLI